MVSHLFVFPHEALKQPIGDACSELPRSVREANSAIADVLRNPAVELLAFWDRSLGDIPKGALGRFADSLDDAWHPGARLTGFDQPDLLRYALPLWVYRPTPPAEIERAISWRFDFRALFVRADLLRALGGLDLSFVSLAGAARELGLRALQGGAVCRQMPSLLKGKVAPDPVPLEDRYRLLRRVVSQKWTGYTLVRRVFERPTSALAEGRAWWATRRTTLDPIGRPMSLQRSLESVELPAHPTVTVVLPTYGRYKYVAEVLEDLRSQTVAPTQILIADGNPVSDREPTVYDRYGDLPLEVLWHEEVGLCSGRNACLDRATGDYVWFVDDDSRFDANNLEMHLRTLAAYGADVSVGPAYTRDRPQLAPTQAATACGFMDCGTTLVRRSLLDEVGGFDMQFNAHLAGEDNDLGIRFLRAGGLMLNNPAAKRFHYLAPVGGSRHKGSAHVFRRWSLRPRPVQSVYYLTKKHFEAEAVVDSVLQAGVTIGWRSKHRRTRVERFRTLVEEVFAMPLTAFRMMKSVQIGREMIARGPSVTSLARPPKSQAAP